MDRFIKLIWALILVSLLTTVVILTRTIWNTYQYTEREKLKQDLDVVYKIHEPNRGITTINVEQNTPMEQALKEKYPADTP